MILCLSPDDALNYKSPHEPSMHPFTLMENQHLAELSKPSLVVIANVKSALKITLMRHGIPRKNTISNMVGMTGRTMQRRLKEEGSSYRELLNELRHEMATELLRNSQLSLGEIGHRLGFQESRSFHRCFKTWTGETPGHYRRKRGRRE